jgi:hypothetical protein
MRNTHKLLRKPDGNKSPGIAGRRGLKYVLKRYGVEWVHVAQDRDQWQNLVKIL